MAETSIARTPRLVAALGDRCYPVASIKDASVKYAAMRDAAGSGSSGTPTVLIYDGLRLVGWLAYNGKVFPGLPSDWHPGITPIYRP